MIIMEIECYLTSDGICSRNIYVLQGFYEVYLIFFAGRKNTRNWSCSDHHYQWDSVYNGEPWYEHWQETCYVTVWSNDLQGLYSAFSQCYIDLLIQINFTIFEKNRSEEQELQLQI